MYKFLGSIAVVFVLISASGVNAGAFGVKAGDPISKFKILENIESNGAVFIAEIKVPTPNSNFQSYVVTYTKNDGICKIGGFGKTNEADQYGVAVRRQFDDLSLTLTKKYGKSLNFNLLHEGASLKEPYEFTMALTKEERVLASFWDAESGSKLTSDISAIALSAEGVDYDKNYIMLVYEFSNYSKCKIAENLNNKKENLN